MNYIAARQTYFLILNFFFVLQKMAAQPGAVEDDQPSSGLQATRGKKTLMTPPELSSTAGRACQQSTTPPRPTQLRERGRSPLFVTKVVISDFSDSQQAIRNYDADRISCQALHALLSSPPPSTSPVHLCAPAHESLSGNAQNLSGTDSAKVPTLPISGHTHTYGVRYNTDNTNTVESWESLLRASEPADQRWLIQRAVEAGVSQGIPADFL
ncbi:hypothetical protein HPB50_012404 [Hyalomma asiaticum]|uniref:Uncharacterized protein n=1 Tax=Hyalomma asiaticum TaxID=266040 RepID=A0ACB7RTJ3_HYAAI|nr:hypothetical protein HPB50_012404 [Hyalomma asiaticum]